MPFKSLQLRSVLFVCLFVCWFKKYIFLFSNDIILFKSDIKAYW